MIIPISILIPYKVQDGTYVVWMQERVTKDQYFQNLEFPGGKVEDGEGPKQSMNREVFEETGIRLKIKDSHLFSQFSFPLREDGKAAVNLVIYVYIFKDQENLFPSSEYYLLNEIVSNETSGCSKKIIKNNYQILNSLATYFQCFSKPFLF